MKFGLDGAASERGRDSKYIRINSGGDEFGGRFKGEVDLFEKEQKKDAKHETETSKTDQDCFPFFSELMN